MAVCGVDAAHRERERERERESGAIGRLRIVPNERRYTERSWRHSVQWSSSAIEQEGGTVVEESVILICDVDACSDCLKFEFSPMLLAGTNSRDSWRAHSPSPQPATQSRNQHQ